MQLRHTGNQQRLRKMPVQHAQLRHHLQPRAGLGLAAADPLRRGHHRIEQRQQALLGYLALRIHWHAHHIAPAARQRHPLYLASEQSAQGLRHGLAALGLQMLPARITECQHHAHPGGQIAALDEHCAGGMHPVTGLQRLLQCGERNALFSNFHDPVYPAAQHKAGAIAAGLGPVCGFPPQRRIGQMRRAYLEQTAVCIQLNRDPRQSLPNLAQLCAAPPGNAAGLRAAKHLGRGMPQHGQAVSRSLGGQGATR